MIKYPDIKVKLIDQDGNAFAILGRVTRAMKKAGVPEAEVQAFVKEATAGDYDNLLFTVMRTVEIE